MKYCSGNYKEVINALKNKEDHVKIGSAGLGKYSSVQDKDQGETEWNQGPPEYLVRYVFK